MRRGPLVCLLPVRNGERDLPGYLECAAMFADAVVALDDGSTDATRELLEASPLVKAILSNPVREGFDGWDDSSNRTRLLDAAAELEPAWIMSLDVDERIDRADAEALRTFVATEAMPGLAFGFRALRMWGDLEHYEAPGYWVYRLFAYEPGQRLPGQRLHFHPIPVSIPRPCWIKTTVRIQHLAGLTPGRREARVEKYRAADPNWSFGHVYPDVVEQPQQIRRWEPRLPGTAVLASAVDEPTQTAGGEERPALSAIVISRDDEERIVRCVSSVVGQKSPWPFEVIVVTSGHDRTADIVRREFPGVTLVELPRPALPGEARNAGLRLARGDYVSFPGSHVELPPGSLAARIKAHDAGYAMVTGTTLNGTDTRAGWASYFLDHSGVLPGRPSTELPGPPAHCSYLRAALLEVGGFREDMRAGEDTVVNQKLAARGYDAFRAQDVTLIHHNRCRTPWQLVTRHFVRGRGFGRILLDRHRQTGRLRERYGTYALFRLQVRQRVAGAKRDVEAWADESLRREYRRTRALVAAGAFAHFLGTWYELLRPGPGKAFVLWGLPVVTTLETAVEERPAGTFEAGSQGVTLSRVDLVTRLIKIVLLPASAVRPFVREAPTAPAAVRRLAEAISEACGVDVRGDESSLGLVQRGILGYARLRTRDEDVHVIDAGELLDHAGARSLEEAVQRFLDTRSRLERTAFVAGTPKPPPGEPERPEAPPRLPPRFAGRRLPAEEVAKVCWQAGWRRRTELVTAVAIAGAESHWFERAWNSNVDGEGMDRGLFQINAETWPSVTPDVAFDAGTNAQYAFAIYRNAGRRFFDWVSYETGSYRNFLPAASEAVAEFLGGERWSYSHLDDDEPVLADAVQAQIDGHREPAT